MRREPAFADVLAGLLPFFATRILYAGAGKIGMEPRGDKGVYQLSQRADFFTEEASVDTLHRRPIVNTRDEPHADPRQWRRLHVICGDANMSEYATALKVGTTYLVICRCWKRAGSRACACETPCRPSRTSRQDQSYQVAGGGRR